MNLISSDVSHNEKEFTDLYNRYKQGLQDLVTIEKTLVYNRLGIGPDGKGGLSIKNMRTLVNYFANEIAIFLGFCSSGTTNSSATLRIPFLTVAPRTSTFSAKGKLRVKLRVLIPLCR